MTVRPLPALAGSILVFWAVTALFGPLLLTVGPGDIVTTSAFSFPAEAGLLGADYLGRDVVARIVYGAGTTLGSALIATLIAGLIGSLLGFIAAWYGGWTDMLISRLVDAFLALPSLILALLVLGTLGVSLPVMIATIAFIESTRVYRLARAVVAEIAPMNYIEAAKARGESVFRIATIEILPGAAGPLSSELGLRFVYAILTVSALSFLGLGVQPPTADWGAMVKENMQGLYLGSPALFAPALAIASVTLAVNVLVDAQIDHGKIASSEEMRR